MKAFIQNFILVITVVVALASCSAEKRLYSRGYHIDWFSKKGISDKAVNANNKVKDSHKTTAIAKSSTPAQQPEKELQTPPESETAAAEPATPEATASDAAPAEKTAQQTKEAQQKSTQMQKTGKAADKIQTLSASLGKKIKHLQTQSSEDGGSGALRTIGWIFIIVGILFVLVVSILIGILLMLVGLLFVASGKKSNKPNVKEEPKKENTTYEDVVYLKNGSIIRGMIMELVLNVTVKIQTKDGSLFVYKMDEVEKITKEPVK